MNELQFAHPQWAQALWGVLAVAFLLVFLELRGGRALERFMAPDSQARLVARPTQGRRWTSLALLILALMAIVIAILLIAVGIAIGFVYILLT